MIYGSKKEKSSKESTKKVCEEEEIRQQHQLLS